MSHPSGAETAAQLHAICDSLVVPRELCGELLELDQALHQVLGQMHEFILLAAPAELQRTIRQLRRAILSDRCRIDPDPHRQTLNLQLCTRQIRLIEHQAGALRAQASIASVNHLLKDISDPGEHELMLNHLRLLNSYHQTHEACILHLQEEISQLHTELRS